MAKSAKKRVGRPSLSDAGREDSKMVGIVMAGEMRKRLKRWAAAQEDKPGMSEAARRLLDISLKKDGF